MGSINIDKEYKEFLIEALSKRVGWKPDREAFHSRVRKEDTSDPLFGTQSIKHARGTRRGYGRFGIDLDSCFMYFNEFVTMATSVVSNQKLTPEYGEDENHGFSLPILENAGVAISVYPFSYEVLVKDKEQLNSIIEGLKTGEKTYIEKFIETNEEEIRKREEENRKKREESEYSREKERIKATLLEKERKKRLHREAKEGLIKEGLIFNERKKSEGRREPIPQEIMDKVWNRDGGACVSCGSREDLEFDHIIPHSKGGATTYRNLQLLCQKCNREKTNKIG